MDFGQVGKVEGRNQIVVPEQFVVPDAPIWMK
jgi:hypothetical protein